jgi:hypothetical protein
MRINGYTYRSTVATMGGKFMVGVSTEAARAIVTTMSRERGGKDR